jgi:hypothetical protein
MRTKILLLMLAMAIAVGFSNALAQSGDSTSTVWVSFAGDNCTINGLPMPVGTSIDAYSHLGVHCGHQEISSPGLYQWMAVYGKDARSPVSAGFCVPDSHVTFKVNGIVATKLGPGSDVWTSNGDTKEMNLAIGQSFAVAATAPPEGSDSAGVIVSYDVAVTNNGNGVDLITLSVTSKHGWVVTGNDASGQYYAAGEHKTLPVTVAIPAGTPLGTQDTLTVVAASKFDPTAKVTKNIVTTVDKKTGVDDGNFHVPGMFTLNQNFPNPFNPETVISFSLDKPGDITLAVYDVLGRTVTTLYQGYLATGQHQFRWNGADGNGQSVASGVYFYRLSSDQISLTRKMALLK